MQKVTILIIIILLLLLIRDAKAGDLEDIASVIAAEACNQKEIGMHAVGSTILNRSKNRHISPVAVVKQKNQYYGHTASNRLALYAQCKATADKIAIQVLNGTLKDIVSGAEYFLLDGERLRAWHGAFTVRIGAHSFYKERN